MVLSRRSLFKRAAAAVLGVAAASYLPGLLTKAKPDALPFGMPYWLKIEPDCRPGDVTGLWKNAVGPAVPLTREDIVRLTREALAKHPGFVKALRESPDDYSDVLATLPASRRRALAGSFDDFPLTVDWSESATEGRT